MKLEQLIFQARPRKPWEAVDLGFKLVHVFWRSLFLSWVALSLPVFILCLILLPGQEYLATVMWWLKPLFERSQLYVLGNGIFGKQQTFGQAVRAFPTYALRQIIPALTWRRLSPTRSFDLPVSQLEYLNGARRAARLQVLHASHSGVAGWLTVILVHVESILLLAVLTGIAMMVPATVELGWYEIVTEHVWLFNLVYFLVFSLVAPFYIACGFALYLNRRIELEGWDIELGFRQIAEQAVHKHPYRQVRHSSEKVPSVMLALLLPLGLILMAPEAVQAESAASERHLVEQNILQAEQRITQVFEDEIFHQIETSYYPKLPDFDDKEEVTDSRIPEWLQALIIKIATAIESILWVLVFCFVLYLLVRYRGWITQWLVINRKATPTQTELPQTLMGLNVAPASLPDDIAGQARFLLAQGQQRECMSLLYRGALARLLSDYQLALSASDTELQCLATVKKQLSASTQSPTEHGPMVQIPTFFSDLTHSWRNIAYGKIAPTDQELERLCDQWRSVFTKDGDAA